MVLQLGVLVEVDKSTKALLRSLFLDIPFPNHISLKGIARHLIVMNSLFIELSKADTDGIFLSEFENYSRRRRTLLLEPNSLLPNPPTSSPMSHLRTPLCST